MTSTGAATGACETEESEEVSREEIEELEEDSIRVSEESEDSEEEIEELEEDSTKASEDSELTLEDPSPEFILSGAEGLRAGSEDAEEELSPKTSSSLRKAFSTVAASSVTSAL